MMCSIIFSMILQTEILSRVTSDFLKQMIILKSFISVFLVHCLTHKFPVNYSSHNKWISTFVILGVSGFK